MGLTLPFLRSLELSAMWGPCCPSYWEVTEVFIRESRYARVAGLFAISRPASMIVVAEATDRR